jgi:hypothetical protein
MVSYKEIKSILLSNLLDSSTDYWLGIWNGKGVVMFIYRTAVAIAKD